MLKALLGNVPKEKALLYILTRGEGYARGIAAATGLHLLSVQNQLRGLERGGILASQLKGRTRIYRFNPRYPFLDELKILLNRTLAFVPEAEREKFYTPRQRPRRSGKPL